MLNLRQFLASVCFTGYFKYWLEFREPRIFLFEAQWNIIFETVLNYFLLLIFTFAFFSASVTLRSTNSSLYLYSAHKHRLWFSVWMVLEQSNTRISLNCIRLYSRSFLYNTFYLALGKYSRWSTFELRGILILYRSLHESSFNTSLKYSNPEI